MLLQTSQQLRRLLFVSWKRPRISGQVVGAGHSVRSTRKWQRDS